MDIKVRLQRTPNPNAMKMVLNKVVRAHGKASYKPGDQFESLMVRDLLGIPHVEQVHLFDEVITISQDGQGDWEQILADAEAVVHSRFRFHDPEEKSAEEIAVREKPTDPQLLEIDEIIDRTIRPGLQADGGDIELVSYEPPYLLIEYQGACGGCPSSSMGTLAAIEGILRSEFNPDIRVRIV